jgi:signal transduction histidine kinase
LIWSGEEQAFVDYDTHLIHLFADQAALALHGLNLHLRSRELAIEQERQRLARDLHDTVTQSLYSIGMAAQASLRLLNQEPNSKLLQPLQHIHTLTQTALSEIRKQIHGLHPTSLTNQSLGDALKQYCASLSQQYDLVITFEIDPELGLSIYQRENLYSIAKEALWNVIKHAGDPRVKIVLRKEAEQIVLLIIDQGTGFALSNSKQSETIGLRSMRERAELIGGSFELRSQPGWGTQIAVRVPM